MGDKLDVIIFGPSIDFKKNVGGISNYVRLIVSQNLEINYFHFVIGKKYFESRRFFWFLKQPLIILYLIAFFLKHRNVRIVHMNMPLAPLAIIRDTFILITAKIFQKKILTCLHGGKFNLNPNTPVIFKWFLKISLLISDRVVTLGKLEKQFLIDRYNVRSSKIIILQNAVEIPNPVPQKDYTRNLSILYFGRLDNNKGLKEIILLLSILRESADFKFLIAGEGPDKVKFIQECERHIPDNFEFLGVISGKQKDAILRQSHVFLLPSHYEGLPFTLLETMAFKIIPFVTKVGSIPEVIQHGFNGCLFDVGDHLSMVNKLKEIIRSRNLMDEISSNAFNTVHSRFNITTYMDKLNQIYRSISLL